MIDATEKVAGRWCDRDIHILRLYYCLVLSEEAYYQEIEAAGVHRKDHGTWMGKDSHGTTTYEKNKDGKDIAIVSIKVDETRTGIQIAGLILHEAVHIWQRHCELIGEMKPSHEFEAYAIQWIAQELMEQYVEQTK